MKIPAPMMPPTTTIVASKGPSARLKSAVVGTPQDTRAGGKAIGREKLRGKKKARETLRGGGSVRPAPGPGVLMGFRAATPRGTGEVT